MAVERATETVQHCKEYLLSAKDTSLHQVGNILGKGDDSIKVESVEVEIVTEKDDEQPTCSIDQAVETIERNRMAAFPFSGFPQDEGSEDDEVDSISGGQVAIE